MKNHLPHRRIYANASRDLRLELGVKEGFSESTLRYATRFYKLYSPLFPNRQQIADGCQILQQPAEELQSADSKSITNLQQPAVILPGLVQSINNPDFKTPEFGGIRMEAGTNRFYISVNKFVEKKER